MCKEQQELLDEGYKNYVAQTMFSSDPTWLKPIPCMDMSTGEKKFGARQYIKEEFIKKCKTDPEFSERWGLTIEERELSLEEQYDLIEKDKHTQFVKWESLGTDRIKEVLDEKNIPTKLITIKYNDKKIESYE